VLRPIRVGGPQRSSANQRLEIGERGRVLDRSPACPASSPRTCRDRLFRANFIRPRPNGQTGLAHDCHRATITLRGRLCCTLSTDEAIIRWQNLNPSSAASGIGHSGFAKQIADKSISLIALGNSVKGFLAFCIA
jgi:hypothetical protein